MKISVVIPAHNRPDFLLEAAASLAAQTYTQWEAVVIDDGSSPPLPFDRLEPVLGKNALYLRHETAQGVSRTKNVGIAAATGEIITILDDDDLLMETALETIAIAFSRQPDLDCLFLGVEPFGPYASNPAANRKAAIDSIVQRTRPIEIEGIYRFGENLFSEFLRSVPIDFQRPAARRGAWNIVGGLDENGLFSESSWTIKASTLCRIGLTRAALTRWRIHDSNFGWQSGGDRNLAILRQLDNGLITTRSLTDDFKRREAALARQLRLIEIHLAESYFSKAYFLRDKDKPSGIRALGSSFRLCPRPRHLKLFFSYLLTPLKNSTVDTDGSTSQ
ncbi:glycosyltransferase family A protein [Aromatoleum petrolei]|uniref:Glycosyltransferase n=1 Tax=Aromatoleum petrolei TaxID=76116 RepID=A0ABX1MMU3_9RHOO|nr:glycosyltransferase family A protein [Aromatoleum petrolei]NMF87369.1 glycosyltransferase [Aromatoleum petrolei]QTQ35736.1 Glycosyl transferase, family 2 [Aromatoleum petrolei]